MIDRRSIDLILRDRQDEIEFRVGDALVHLTEYLNLVEDVGLAEASRCVLHEDQLTDEMEGVIGRVADRIAKSLPGLNGAIFGKALQEALLDASGLCLDGELSGDHRWAKKFLTCGESRGLVELCLEFYVFHVVWIAIQDDLRSFCEDEQTFVEYMFEVGAMSRAAVDAVVQEAGDSFTPRVGVSMETATEVMGRIRRRLFQFA